MSKNGVNSGNLSNSCSLLETILSEAMVVYMERATTIQLWSRGQAASKSAGSDRLEVVISDRDIV